MSTRTVQISDLVAEALTAQNKTAEQVLRVALGIKAEHMELEGGVILPNGTHFRTWYKDRPHGGTVVDGQMELDGERFHSVSGAARHVTGRPTNGWDFWEVRRPGTDWIKLQALRNEPAPAPAPEAAPKPSPSPKPKAKPAKA